MRKLVVSLMVVASFTLADELPAGSQQYQTFYALGSEIGEPVPCPPEVQLEGIESGCVHYPGKAEDFARAVHDAIETRAIPLDAVERVWGYDAEFQRYGRSFSLSTGGDFRVIYDTRDGQTPNVTIFFTP